MRKSKVSNTENTSFEVFAALYNNAIIYSLV